MEPTLITREWQHGNQYGVQRVHHNELDWCYNKMVEGLWTHQTAISITKYFIDVYLTVEILGHFVSYMN